MSVIRDVTERKQAEEQVRELSQRLTYHVDNSPLAVIEWGPDLRLTRWSGEAERIFGWTAGEVLGRRLEEYGFGAGRNSRKDGSVVHCEWYSSTLLDAQGKIRSVLSLVLDVSARKQAEAKLEEAKRLLDALMEYVPEGIAIADAPDVRIRAVSRCGREMLGATLPGMTVEEVAARWKVYEPDDLTPMPDAGLPLMRAISRGETVKDQEVIHINDAGQHIPLLCNAAPIRDGSGAIVGGVAAWRDITERKRTDERIRQLNQDLARRNAELDAERARWKQVVEGIADEVWVCDAEGAVSLINLPAVTHPVEQALEEIEVLDPDGEPRPAEQSPLLRALRGEVVRGEEMVRHRPTGRVRWRQFSAAPIRGTEGAIIGSVAVARDITAYKQMEQALRESEERFALALQAAQEGLWDWNMETDAVFYSTRWKQMLGYSEAEIEPHSSAWQRLMHPADKERVNQLVEAVRRGKGEYEAEFRLRHKDGHYVHILSRGFPIRRPADGKVIRMVGTHLDLTERKRAEESLRQAQKLESIGLLAGGIAHDFNNLLVGVIGNSSLALDLLPPGHRATELLEHVIQSGESAAHLTRQMLAYSGKGRFIVEPLDLSGLVVEISELVRPSIPKKATLNLNLERNLPPVQADRGQLHQVIMNLLLNAAEAIGNDTGLISVKTGVEDVDERNRRLDFEGAELHPGSYVLLEVRDNGCGMDEATKAKIFDPFFTTKFTGRGLGLAAVAGILRGHKGAVKVTSEPGTGTCFLVLFPAAATALLPIPEGARKRADLQGSGTVLVVDDEEIVREVTARTLERYGFDVLLAESGRTAIDLFARDGHRVSLIILDLSMPGMSGEEALRELRKIRPEIDVIVSSGYSEAETMKMFDGQRVSAFIQKPYAASRLAETVKSVIN